MNSLSRIPPSLAQPPLRRKTPLLLVLYEFLLRAEETNVIYREIYEDGVQVPIVSSEREFATFDAVVNIGVGVVRGLPWIAINSTGWVARVATARSGVECLPWTPGTLNACGAHAAACFGTGLAFLTILGREPAVAQEISLLTHEDGNLGSLDCGPALPDQVSYLNALVMGCGAVTNGWAYTIKRLPIVSNIEAVDRQSLKIENIGPYVLAKRSLRGKPKAEIIESHLSPKIKVTPRHEEWELFKIRLNFGRTSAGRKWA